VQVTPQPSALTLLRRGDFRAFLLALVLAAAAESALAILLGVTVYQITRDPLALAWLGLVEAAPAIALVLVGGHVADRFPRRRLVIACRLAMAALTAGVALAATVAPTNMLPTLYLMAFGVGIVRAFKDPAHSGLEAQVVPAELAVQGASLLGTTGRACRLAAPVAGGFLYDAAGPAATYAVIAFLLAVSAVVLLLFLPHRPPPGRHADTGGMAADIAEGLRYVFRHQVLVSSMALDLFAVFFGGMVGLLPMFGDLLGVGAQGVGIMRAALSAGGLTAMAVALRFPPRERAGLALLIAVAGFGIAVIGFGLSTDFRVSVALLFIMGACDGISVVVRHAIVRLAAPDRMRGRIAAVRMVFLNSSNELGDFESGVAAHLVGPALAVAGGGAITLVVVVVTAVLAPKLRRLNLRELGPST
jgi:MFS family permease